MRRLDKLKIELLWSLTVDVSPPLHHSAGGPHYFDWIHGEAVWSSEVVSRSVFVMLEAICIESVQENIHHFVSFNSGDRFI